MFRQAKATDITAVTAIYDAIHTEIEAGRMEVGWVRHVYPVRATAVDAVAAGELYIEEYDGRIVAAARINQQQAPEYVDAHWQYPALPADVMVLHTLVADPAQSGHGYGAKLVEFYADFARQQGCHYLRMDTSVKNVAARALYKRLGFDERGEIDLPQPKEIGMIRLVCLERPL